MALPASVAKTSLTITEGMDKQANRPPTFIFSKQFLNIILSVARHYGAEDLGASYIRPLVDSGDISLAEFFCLMDFGAHDWADANCFNDPEYIALSPEFESFLVDGDEPDKDAANYAEFEVAAAKLNAAHSRLVSDRLRTAGLNEVADFRDSNPTMYEAFVQEGCSIRFEQDKGVINLGSATKDAPYFWTPMYNPTKR